MSKPWPKAKLGEVLRRSEETIELQPDAEYRQITVKLWGKGPVLRGILTGAEIAASRQMVARRGQFILSRIDARNGALGIVPPELDEAIVTNDFPVFNVVEERLLPTYLGWMCRTESFVEQCKRASEGTTNRVRLQEDKFLTQEISLPPLMEQRRLVGRIEELAAQIGEARVLRHQAAEEAEALGKAGGNLRFIEAKKHFGSKRLEDLATRITKGESPEWQGFTYQESGPCFVRSENVLWGSLDLRNAVHIPRAFHAKLSRSQLRKDDVLINLVGASIGRVCSVPENLGDANVNQAVGVISPNQECLLPDFLVHFLLSPVAQDEIHGGKVETARPNISLGDVRDLEIPTPPLPEQRRIVAELDALQAELHALKRLQAETAVELDALMPSILSKAFSGEL
ncbi:MAG: restriction endonuclease subunit S [Bryobacteraceae bacterium]|jgi:type I restriction enzyme S subunit